jgi:two-component system chemotaxis response regulator CheY
MSRILITDDAAFMRMMLTDILKKAGHEVVGQATNGLEAVEKYQQLNPDILITDITMPDMDGVQAVKEIRKIDPQAKIIICSSIGQKAMVNEAIQFGAKEFILKPFQADQVINAINKLVLIEKNTTENESLKENEDPQYIDLLKKSQNLLTTLPKEELSALLTIIELFTKKASPE